MRFRNGVGFSFNMWCHCVFWAKEDCISVKQHQITFYSYSDDMAPQVKSPDTNIVCLQFILVISGKYFPM